MRPLVRSLIFAMVVAVAVLAVWRPWQRSDPLAPLMPGVGSELRSILAAGEVEAAIGTAVARGHWESARIYEQLRDALVDAEGLDQSRRRREVLPALSTWGEALARGYDLPEYRRDAAFWRQADPATTAELILRWRDLRTALASGELPPDSVRSRLQEHAAAFRRAGDHFGTARTGYDLGNICLKLGRIDEARRRFEELLADGRRWRLTAATCDALNSLALFALVDGDSSGAAYLGEALALARPSRLAARAGRALTVAAMHARNEGGFARSMDLLEEAVTTCGELGEAWQGLPYLIYLMRFHAGLDDWRQVGGLMPRAEALLREAETAAADPLMLRRESVRLRELKLRLAIHEGRVEEALADYPRLLAEARRQPFAEVTYIHDREVRALLACGRPDAALDVLPVALEHAEANMRPETLSLLLARAEANLALDRLDAAAAALDRFDEVAVTRAGWAGALRLDALALRALLQHRVGDPASATSLRAGLELLAADLAESDASSLAYVELQRNRLLRQALREIVPGDCATGEGVDLELAYGVELLWRRLPAWLGSADLPAQLVEDPRGLARVLSARRRARIAAGTCLLLYIEHGEGLVRWTVDGHGSRVDTLATTAAAVRGLADGLLEEMGRDPGDAAAPVPDRLAALAEELATVLLPETVRAGPRPRRLLVSGDNVVAQLPFAVLDIAPGPRYHPLAAEVAVARLRDAGEAPPWRDDGAAVVVADPEVTDLMRRRHPGLTELAATAADVARVQSLVPAARVLAGSEATLQGLRQVWEAADLLYFACHTVRSAESPFRTYLPLSQGPDASPLVTPYLDVSAIRAADLHRCRLVVLASCASGAPYVSGRAWAPGLGDAFVDAGAGAVLQTLWRVRDEDAAGIPARFLATWLAGASDPVAALAVARREAMTAPGGQARHPFGWAAYVLELRDD